MRRFGLLILILVVADTVLAQTIETRFSLESRSGYSTNTLLHPFVNEWDTAGDGVFARVVPSGQMHVNISGFSIDIGGGLVFESIFDDRNSWNGAFGSAGFRYKLTKNVSTGLRANASKFSSSFDKYSMLLLQDVTWNVGISTRLQAKAGSYFSRYSGLTQNSVENFDSRTDLYGIELEHWPTISWQLRATAYGMMGEKVSENHSFSFSVGRALSQKAGVSLSLSSNKFTNSFNVNPDVGGSFGPGTVGSGPVGSEVVALTDRTLRTGLDLNYSISNRLNSFATLSHNTFWSGNGGYRSDIAAHIGIRYSLSGRDLFGKQDGGVTPAWNRKNNGVVVEVMHKGSGDLFLTGDFNSWEKPGIALSKQEDKRYAAELDLEAGIYEYKVLMVENDEMIWVEISEESMTVSDGFGGTNGLIFIED